MISHRVYHNVAALIFAVLFCCFILVPVSSSAQTTTHTVQKGDTLWSICEKYYGNADLWPKLWQMNPFITNPHFLHKGDVITLIEKKPAKKVELIQTAAAEPVPEVKKPEPKEQGLDLSQFAHFNQIGYLTKDIIQPLGKIVSPKSAKVLLSKGDFTYARFNSENIKIGDEFSICKSVSAIKNPETKKLFGYEVLFHGKLAVREMEEKDFFKIEIIESFGAIEEGDLILPIYHLSSCVKPLPEKRDIYARIVAAQEQRQAIGTNDIVYLDKGFNQGIKRGNVLTVIDLDWTKAKKPSYMIFYIGTVIVIETRPETSTAIILTMDKNISQGALVKTVSWTEIPEFFTRQPSCDLE